MFESYKNKLNHSQLYIFEKLEKEILGNISSLENKIIAYENLVFTPKKDGNEKQEYAWQRTTLFENYRKQILKKVVKNV